MKVSDDAPTPQHAGPEQRPTPENTIPPQEAREQAFRVALGILGHHRRELAEDVAQEAVISLLRPGRVINTVWQALLHTITSNLALNRRRNEATLARYVRFSSEATQAREPSSRSTPLDALVEEELQAELDLLLEQVDDEFGVGTRAILDYRSEGIPWREIAGLVDLAERTCRYRKKVATRWLCERLSLQVVEGGQHE